MTLPTLGQVVSAIESALGSATGLTRSENYNELTEGIPETPLLQVYPESGEPDFQTYKRRIEKVIIHADLYARQRSQIGEDMTKIVDMAEAIFARLRAQDPNTNNQLFGLDGIRKFAWTWTRAVFEYGDPATRYAGVRFIITIWIDR